MDKLVKEEFDQVINSIIKNDKLNIEYLYNVYEIAFDSIEQLLKNQNVSPTKINSYSLISYVLGEYLYSTNYLDDKQLEDFISKENILYSMSSVSADKYLSLSLFNHNEVKLTNEYLPPISSLNLYVNLMLNIVTRYKRNDPKNTLIVDLLVKSLSIARSVINLLCEGYETQALAIWRTLHECECTLILINKYKDIAINSYLKHMSYGIAYRGEFNNKEEEGKVLSKIKEEMNEIGLKSKDTKKYIEYGWLLAIPESKTKDNFKLNFRDGLETLAGLHSKSDVYMLSSEILHSTPLLIYSNKNYFYYLTLLNLYESFFRIEAVFEPLFFSTVGENGKTSYLKTRELYYSQLINIYKRELSSFKNIKKGK